MDVHIEKSRMNIALNLPGTPVCHRKKLKEFQLIMHVMFPDFINQQLKKEVVCSDILNQLPETVFICYTGSGKGHRVCCIFKSYRMPSGESIELSAINRYAPCGGR
jgi:hypothetical protein